MRKAISINLDNIVVAFFVRKQLSEGRVSQLIKLMESKVILPPIKVWHNEGTDKFEVIDGRHRLEACSRMEYDSIECNIIDEPDFAKRVGMAVSANSTGPLTATDEDFEIAIQGLLDAQVPMKRILEVFPLPKSYTIKIVHAVKSKLYKAATTLAVDAILNRGMTVVKAAEEFRVEPKAIRERITGRAKVEKDQITDFTGGFSHRFISFQKNNTNDYAKLIEAYDTGRMSPEAVRSIFKRVEKSMRTAVSVVEDYHARFEARLPQKEEKAG
ncbi:MAG TPA: ParB/RepB/Spo0J family partition protein [Bacteroidia bacterium]|jgi:hypothetical protein|nr:ParB/RepB/Spo0J family partition protein [Bacteroidia bacterium]